MYISNREAKWEKMIVVVYLILFLLTIIIVIAFLYFSFCSYIVADVYILPLRKVNLAHTENRNNVMMALLNQLWFHLLTMHPSSMALFSEGLKFSKNLLSEWFANAVEISCQHLVSLL